MDKISGQLLYFEYLEFHTAITLYDSRILDVGEDLDDAKMVRVSQDPISNDKNRGVFE